jgi:hypothetical protein
VFSYIHQRKSTRNTFQLGNWFQYFKVAQDFNVSENNDELVASIRQNNVASGGPKCNFKAIEVPCMCQYSPQGGITPRILTNCLQRMDELNLFPRSPNKIPFILFDGHDSRFNLEFLKYICDDNHPWSICIGLP